MFTTLLIGEDAKACDAIQGAIAQYCRDIVFQGMTPAPKAASGQDLADLIFWDARGQAATQHAAQDSFPSTAINVLLLDEPLPAQTGTADGHAWSSVHTCLYKPIRVPELLIALSNGRSLLELRRAFQSQQRALERIIERQNNPGIVGIPTEEGLELMPASDIMRCEGLNKYTMIVTTNKERLISSYNIGEFCKILQMFGFFSAHKSHLVNLRCVRRLTNENQLVLHDGSLVPLSRRRRLDFLQRFREGGY